MAWDGLIVAAATASAPGESDDAHMRVSGDPRVGTLFATNRLGNPAAAIGHEGAVEPEDSVLWSRARAGDAEAFGELFDRHARTIYNYCFRRIGSWAAAEDLVSIIFLEAWRRLDKPLPGGKELPWLYGIATNVVRNRRRAERRYAAALRRVPEPDPEPSFADDSDQRLDDEKLMRRALELLGRLPRREQEVFALCAWSELSYEDAAAALRIPVGTVRSRLSRARARLRELDPAGGHEPMNMQIVEEAIEP
jgi:RNA polymerase sigma-70 factor (ECF subfamily)